MKYFYLYFPYFTTSTGIKELKILEAIFFGKCEKAKFLYKKFDDRNYFFETYRFGIEFRNSEKFENGMEFRKKIGGS